MRKIILAYLLLFFAFKIEAQDFKQVADSLLKKYNIPEMAFAVLTEDSILIKSAVGKHRTEDTVKNASFNDYFHLGSNTKALSSFIAAYLVEQGKIKWDTKFFDLFPQLKSRSDSGYFSITLKGLLSHRGRIQAFTSGAEFKKLPGFRGNKQEQRIEFVKHVLKLKPINNNEAYNYSNAGYSVASVMLEKVANTSWENLVKEVFNEKLKFSVWFGWPNRNNSNQPWGHWVEDSQLISIKPAYDYNLNFIEPAGDLSMNITDYSKFIQLNLQGMFGQDNILKSETYKYIHNCCENYSLGWSNYQEKNLNISEHAGSDGTFFCYTQIDRDRLIAYIVIVNSGTQDAQMGVFQMIELFKKQFGK